MIMSIKQIKIKIEPRIKLNHNICMRLVLHWKVWIWTVSAITVLCAMSLGKAFLLIFDNLWLTFRLFSQKSRTAIGGLVKFHIHFPRTENSPLAVLAVWLASWTQNHQKDVKRGTIMACGTAFSFRVSRWNFLKITLLD